MRFYLGDNGIYTGDCLPGDRVATDDEVAAYQSAQAKAVRIIKIESELIEIDNKRIRPLAEGDTEYLSMLNQKAIILRDELRVLTK